MDTLQQLIESLASAYNPDYWSDVMQVRIGKQLDGLGDKDWQQLEASWETKPTDWRIRLAEACLLTDKPRATDLLVALLKSPEPEVGSLVAEMLLEKNYQWSPEVSLLADLKRHWEQASPSLRPSLENLIDRLPM